MVVRAESIDFASVDTSSWMPKAQKAHKYWKGQLSKRWRCLAVMYANRGVPADLVLPEIQKACDLRGLGEADNYYRYLAKEGFAPGDSSDDARRTEVGEAGFRAGVSASDVGRGEHSPSRRTARLFMNGGSQAVRLPAEFRFEETVEEVLIWRDPDTGNIVLSAGRPTIADFIAWRDSLGPLSDDDRSVMREIANDRAAQGQDRRLFGEDQ